MNNLEQYKQKLLSDSREYNADDAIEHGMETGFDAAIVLNLPIKFAEWIAELEIAKDDEPFMWWWNRQDGSNPRISTKELYEYWINNIYKP